MESSPAAKSPAALAGASDGVRTSWTAARARLDSKTLPTILAATAVAFGCALLLFHNPLFALGAACLILTATLPPFIPMRYVLDEHGASVRIGTFVLYEMAWKDVRCASCVRGGIKLSAFDNPAATRLESGRGVRLRYPATLAGQVEAEVARRRAVR